MENTVRDPMGPVSRQGKSIGEPDLPLPVGANILRFRRAAGMTLKDLAKRSGVSIATISKIENGKNSGGFETVYKIARGLGILVTEIIGPEQGDMQDVVVHRRSAKDRHPTGIYDYFPQASRRHGALTPFVMVIHTREVPDRRDWSIHRGEEVIYVLSGSIALHRENEAAIRLQEGDSACFDSGKRHAFVCTSPTPAKIISVATRNHIAPA